MKSWPRYGIMTAWNKAVKQMRHRRVYWGVALALAAGASGALAFDERTARLDLDGAFARGEWMDENRQGEFRRAIDNFAAMFRLDPRFVQAVVAVESNYNPKAVSRKGAQGLMQLMPKTAKQYGVKDAFNPVQNVEGGARHLRYLLDRYGGNLELTLAAYNAGETAVEKHGGIPPFPETRDYVNKVLALYYRTLTLPKDRWYRYEDAEGRMGISNAVPAGARNISPVVFSGQYNF